MRSSGKLELEKLSLDRWVEGFDDVNDVGAP